MPRKLTTKQLKAVRLLVQGESFSSIARTLKMRRETISRWRNIPEFIQECEKLIDEMRKGFKSQLTILVGKSIDTLQIGIKYDESNPKRLKTALDIIKIFGKEL